jgi:hypothetical protein
VVKAAQQHDFQNLRFVVMRRQRGEFRLAERGRGVQRIDGCDQRLLGGRPARRVGLAEHRGADLFVGQVRGSGKRCDMHAPFVLAFGQRAGAIDDDFALAQRQRAAVEQAAGAELLPGARAAGQHPEQRQRRRAAHDAVELQLDLRRVRRLERRDP